MNGSYTICCICIFCPHSIRNQTKRRIYIYMCACISVHIIHNMRFDILIFNNAYYNIGVMLSCSYIVLFSIVSVSIGPTMFFLSRSIRGVKRTVKYIVYYSIIYRDWLYSCVMIALLFGCLLYFRVGGGDEECSCSFLP